MRWQGGRRSTNVEDRRGGGGGFGLPSGFGGGRGGGGFRLPIGGKGGGCGCLGVVVIVVLALMGVDVTQILSLLGGGGAAPPQTQQPMGPSEPTDTATDFVYVILGDLEDTWSQIFAEQNQNFPEPTLVLFDRAVQSACGMAGSATGPFYCPADQKVYLDLSFLDQMRQLGAPGDFAFAYVIAHEVGHHIQQVTGIAPRMREAQRRNPRRENELSVRLELQADCLAGVWGYHARDEGAVMLEEGDIEEGLRAAAAIGDDRLQERAGQRSQPESFTHGTSEQRASWLRRGLTSGDPDQCDTFEGIL